MNTRTVMLAKQLLETVPKAEVDDLVRLLQYFNRFNVDERVKAMRYGSQPAADRFLEESVQGELREELRKSAGQLSYVTTNQDVCKCCGK